MRKAPYLLAAATLSGLALMATSSSASPLASGLASGDATLPALNEGLVQDVQAWFCQGKRSDWDPEQYRFCGGGYRYYDYYDDYGPGYGYASPGYGYGYPYGYQGYGVGIVPFIGFGLGVGRHHRHHHHSGGWH
jgi:hypothetical protein